jgi:drug/metabolite transporter (DMT)-like permease
MKRNVGLGLMGAVGIWLTAGFALPFVNVLKDFSPEQLMVFRGFLTAAMAWSFMRERNIFVVDTYTVGIGIVLPLATLGLFEGIRHWGAGPTLIVITATPLVNMFIGPFVGRRTNLASLFALALILGGVVMARWGGRFDRWGLGWSVFGTIMNGILYEFFARSKAGDLQKCLCGSLGMGVLGLVLSLHLDHSWAPLNDPRNIGSIFGFALVGGLFYWLANLATFKYLPTLEASILAQGETPAVIIGAYFVLHESLSPFQQVGVGISLIGAGLLCWFQSKSAAKPVPSSVDGNGELVVT